MIIYPAIDLHHGNCVRLQQGELAAETIFSPDPAAVAQYWQSQGAEWLHVVNLDGAFTGSGKANLKALKGILAAVQIPVQFGGGLRKLDDIQAALGMGVARVVLGTVALTQPDIVKQALEKWGPERIVVGIDARNGQVAIQGWTKLTSIQAVDFAKMLKLSGVQHVVYTDIARDGMLSGLDVAATSHLAAESGLRVIASGGVAGLDDIRSLLQVEELGIEGVIIGMALYRGTIDFQEALRCIREGHDAG